MAWSASRWRKKTCTVFFLHTFHHIIRVFVWKCDLHCAVSGAKNCHINTPKWLNWMNKGNYVDVNNHEKNRKETEGKHKKLWALARPTTRSKFGWTTLGHWSWMNQEAELCFHCFRKDACTGWKRGCAGVASRDLIILGFCLSSPLLTTKLPHLCLTPQKIDSKYP